MTVTEIFVKQKEGKYSNDGTMCPRSPDNVLPQITFNSTIIRSLPRFLLFLVLPPILFFCVLSSCNILYQACLTCRHGTGPYLGMCLYGLLFWSEEPQSLYNYFGNILYKSPLSLDLKAELYTLSCYINLTESLELICNSTKELDLPEYFTLRKNLSGNHWQMSCFLLSIVSIRWHRSSRLKCWIYADIVTSSS